MVLLKFITRKRHQMSFGWETAERTSAAKIAVVTLALQTGPATRASYASINWVRF
jgi:hypothetical protein